jgi:hypothetical protein
MVESQSTDMRTLPSELVDCLSITSNCHALAGCVTHNRPDNRAAYTRPLYTASEHRVVIVVSMLATKARVRIERRAV